MVLHNVAYIETLVTNCISLPVAKNRKFKFYDDDKIYISNGTTKFNCNERITRGNSFLIGFKVIKKVKNNNVNLLSINKLHSKLCHPNNECVIRTAKHYDMEIREEEKEVCEDCAIAKSRRKKLSKVNTKPVKQCWFVLSVPFRHHISPSHFDNFKTSKSYIHNT